MALRRALKRQEMKGCNSEATWPIPKSLIKRTGPRAPTPIHVLLGQFTLHDLCDENHERRVENRIQAQHQILDDNPHESVGLCLNTALLRLTKLIQTYVLYTYKLITIVTYNNIKILLLHA
jgi:hypothetical protein